MMKKMIAMILCLLMVFSLIGCGKNAQSSDETPSGAASAVEEAPNPDSEGAKLYKEFNKILAEGKTLQEVSEYLAQESVSGYDCATQECSEGYLNGFSEEIKGFSKCYAVQPWIGSIPFVCYVFETDDASALKENLIKAADPRWNICTEAEETIALINGNYVFFAMLPGAEG